MYVKKKRSLFRVDFRSVKRSNRFSLVAHKMPRVDRTKEHKAFRDKVREEKKRLLYYIWVDYARKYFTWNDLRAPKKRRR